MARNATRRVQYYVASRQWVLLVDVSTLLINFEVARWGMEVDEGVSTPHSPLWPHLSHFIWWIWDNGSGFQIVRALPTTTWYILKYGHQYRYCPLPSVWTMQPRSVFVLLPGLSPCSFGRWRREELLKGCCDGWQRDVNRHRKWANRTKKDRRAVAVCCVAVTLCPQRGVV